MAAPTQTKCNFESTLELLGRKHTLVILRVLFEADPRRFNELKQAADVNAKTLSDRLDELQDEGLVAREAYNELPRRVEYELTPMGEDLGEIFRTLQAWRQKYE